MFSLHRLFFVVTLLCCAAPSLARPLWGPLGHYMTAAIAQQYLSANATNGCANLLPDVGGQIAFIASWADNVAREKYPWSPPLHYINTPDWKCDYLRSRDCIGPDGEPNFCVDGAIQNYTSQIVQNTGQYDLTEALMFLVHFVGDIHQPLHCGFTGDEGGNTETGTFEGTPDRRLHQVWDEDMLEKRLNDDYQGDNSTYIQYYLNRLETGDWSKQRSNWTSCSSAYGACTEVWANESVRLTCSNAEIDSNGNHIQDGFDLEDPYYNTNYPVAERRIAMGGVRLASILNHIFSADSLAHLTTPPVDIEAQ